MKDQLLMTPGPTPVPPEIAGVMAEPIIHHRTREYREIFKDAVDGLKEVFKTGNDCLVFSSSGTGAMEASVCNVLSPGDKAVVIRGGKFGERYYDICKSFGIDAVPIDIKWGEAPDPRQIRDVLEANSSAKAVYTELCETSTATVFAIEAIGKVVRNHQAILVVDAISGLGADDFRVDEWGVDIAVSGSQKALMLPPGLSFCAVSPKAWKAVKGSKLPKYYYDFNRYKKALDKNDTPFTPGITLTKGLRASLGIVRSKGIDNVLKECAAMADAVRGKTKALGLELFSKSPSNAVTAIKMPEARDASEIIKAMKERGITVAGGQAELKGKIIRIAHMGGITMSDVERTVVTLTQVLKEL